MRLVKPMESIDERVVAYNYECAGSAVSSTSNGNCGTSVSGGGDSGSSSDFWSIVAEIGWSAALLIFKCT